MQTFFVTKDMISISRCTKRRKYIFYIYVSDLLYSNICKQNDRRMQFRSIWNILFFGSRISD